MRKQKGQDKKEAEGFAFAWTDHAWEDYLYCQRHPFTGTGKPEPLKNNLTGFWSRRITKEHRLVYLAEDDAIDVVACRFHLWIALNGARPDLPS